MKPGDNLTLKIVVRGGEDHHQLLSSGWVEVPPQQLELPPDRYLAANTVALIRPEETELPPQ
jgi:hypothetical protein